VQDTWVAPELCDAIASLLAQFDAEIASAVRADPGFVPTRYLSTRTAVRCAELLRAAAVHRRIFGEPGRSTDARHDDLALLRLHLVLGGPSPTDVAALLERESDPVERRQLEILRTEREIFEGCLAKVERRALTPKPRLEPAPAKPQASFAEGAARARATAPAPAEAPAPEPGPLDRLEAELGRAVADADDERVGRVARDLAEASRAGAPDEERARRLLDRAASALASLALAESLRLTEPETDLLAVVRRLAKLATSLEDDTVSMHATASFLRERAIDAIAEVAAHGLGLDAQTMIAACGEGALDPAAATDRVLGAASELAALRKELWARSPSRTGDEHDERWTRAAERLEAELVTLWSRSFAQELAASVEAGKSASLGQVLDLLSPELTKLDGIDARLEAATGRAHAVKARVVGPRLLPILRAALSRAELADRAALVAEVRALSTTLDEHALEHAVPTERWLEVVAQALRGAEPAKRPKAKSFDRQGYRKLRAAEQRTPILASLAEVALTLGDRAVQPESAASLLGRLDPAEALEVARLDLARTERAVAFLQRWWQELAPAGHAPEASEALGPLLRLLRDDAALARFSLEARLVEQLVPAAADEARALRERIDALDATTRAASQALVATQAEALFERSLGAR
jgi:hypothetical protein